MNTFEQGLLTYLSPKQLTQIQSYHIGIGGCGGLGSNVAILLARTGFRYFTLMDHDIVDASNLNRQCFTLKDIGQPKASCLTQKLHDINPDLVCHFFDTKWIANLPDDPFQSCPILIEAFDTAETKTAFIDYYNDTANCLVSGNGLAGINGPRFSIQQHGNLFIVGDGTTAVNKEHPPLAPRVTRCASMMAETIITYVLSVPTSPIVDDEPLIQ